MSVNMNVTVPAGSSPPPLIGSTLARRLDPGNENVLGDRGLPRSAGGSPNRGDDFEIESRRLSRRPRRPLCRSVRRVIERIIRETSQRSEAVMPQPFRGTVNIDIQDSVPDWEPYRQPIAADGSPSVLYIVLDDVGFSALESFGGLIDTPNIKRIADRGLRYTG